MAKRAVAKVNKQSIPPQATSPRHTPWFSLAVAMASGPVLKLFFRAGRLQDYPSLVRRQIAAGRPMAAAYAHMLLCGGAIALKGVALHCRVSRERTTGWASARTRLVQMAGQQAGPK